MRSIGLAEPDITEADIAAVARVLRTGWLTSGAECRALEEELSGYLDGAHVISVSSGTAALELAFAYLGLPPGARVGVPTWTFPASAFSGVHHGAVPVLLDVSRETLNVSPEAVAAAIEEGGLAALVAVHFGGTPVARAVRELCAQRGIPVIEDAAHAFGACDERGPISGRGSVAAAFSFYATKNLTSAEGGALATHNAELADFARVYRLHGMTKKAGVPWNPDVPDEIIGPGFKANLSDVLAALARSQFQRFTEVQTRRRELVTRYRANLSIVEGVEPVPAVLVEGSADHLMTVALAGPGERHRAITALADARITTSLHFRPLHHYRWFAEHTIIGPTGTAVADEMAERMVSLPLHPRLTACDVDRVCQVLADALA